MFNFFLSGPCDFCEPKVAHSVSSPYEVIRTFKSVQNLVLFGLMFNFFLSGPCDFCEPNVDHSVSLPYEVLRAFNSVRNLVLFGLGKTEGQCIRPAKQNQNPHFFDCILFETQTYCLAQCCFILK